MGYAVQEDGEGLFMSNVDNPKCCGRSMLRVIGESPYWDCPVCGTRRNHEGTIITPGEPDVRANSRSDGRVAVRGNAKPDESHTSRSGDEGPDGSSADPAQATDYQPKCWKCGRVLGRYFSRPWSIKCRRCKATNQGALKGA